MAKTKVGGTCLVPLDEEDWSKIKELAEREKLPKTEVIRRAIRARHARWLADPSGAASAVELFSNNEA